MSKRTVRRRGGRGLLTLGLSLVLVAGLVGFDPVPGVARAEPGAAPVSVDDAVADAVADGGRADFLVSFDAQADLSAAAGIGDWSARGQWVVERLQVTADRSQTAVRAELDALGTDYEVLWAANVIAVHQGDEAALDAVVARPEVAEVTATAPVSEPAADAPAAEAEPAAEAGGEDEPVAPSDRALAEAETTQEAAAPWNLEQIGATRVWDEFGVTGEGVTVGVLGTGANLEHPAVQSSYRGNRGDGTFDHNYSWFDAAQLCTDPEPCDIWSTGPLGIVVGQDEAGDPIGVAPGARWIAANACGPVGGAVACRTEDLLAAGQWLLAPTDLAGNNPRPDLRPHVVHNDWLAFNVEGHHRGAYSAQRWFNPVAWAWEAAGMFATYLPGSLIYSCGGLKSPGDQPHGYTVGASGRDGRALPNSARGPGSDGDVDLAAPGADIPLVAGTGYTVDTHPDYGAPHAAGAVALLWSAVPMLVGDLATTTKLLDDAAVDVDDLSCGGTADDNSVVGEGVLDAYATVAASPHGPTGTVRGVVRDTATEEPVAGAPVRLVTPEYRRTVTTDAAGGYQAAVLAGEVEVVVDTYGYQPRTVTVPVAEGEAATANLPLAPAAGHHAVSGQVSDADGRPVAGATVSVRGAPLPAATTDGQGAFGFASVAEGRHRVEIDHSDRCFETTVVEVRVDGDAAVEATLPYRYDEFGYHCTTTAPDYTESTGRLLPLNPQFTTEPDSVAVDLPFPVALYGKTYHVAHVSTFGYVSLGSSAHDYGSPSPVPVSRAPNAAVYPFGTPLGLCADDWRDDDRNYRCDPDPGDHQPAVTYEVRGTAPDRQAVVEWHDVTVLPGGRSVDSLIGGINWQLGPLARRGAVDVQLLLGEDGSFTFQYRSLDDADERGLATVVGIEDATGLRGFQYSFHEPALREDRAIRIVPPPGGSIAGTVRDGNDGDPVPAARVTAVDDASGEETTAYAGQDGSYRLWVPSGDYTVTATAARYADGSAAVSVADREVAGADLTLATPALDVDVAAVERIVRPGQRRSARMRLTNPGTQPLEWSLHEAGGASAGEEPSLARVLRSWEAPVANPWGVAVVGDRVWTGVSNSSVMHELTTDGATTHRVSVLDGGRDVAYDELRDLVCKLVGDQFFGDWRIACFSGDTGHLAESVATGFGNEPGTDLYGLAHAAAGDVFLASRDDGTIDRFAGLSHPEPGAHLGECRPAVRLFTLAVDPVTGTLWGSAGTLLYEIDPVTCATLRVVEAPVRSTQGLAVDTEGHLWTVRSTQRTVVELDVGPRRASYRDVPWLAPAATEGVLAPGEAQTVEVGLDATGLAVDRHLAELVFETNAGRAPTRVLPAALTVTDYRVGVNVAGREAFEDTRGDTWAADQPFEPGGWGWDGAPRIRPYLRPIAGTEDDELYQWARVGDLSYRFDGVPDGVYRVEVRLAELEQREPFERVFDVRAEGEPALALVDVADQVGTRTALELTFTVTVTDGRLDISAVPLPGSAAPPLLNGLRVTRLPDRTD